MQESLPTFIAVFFLTFQLWSSFAPPESVYVIYSLPPGNHPEIGPRAAMQLLHMEEFSQKAVLYHPSLSPCKCPYNSKEQLPFRGIWIRGIMRGPLRCWLSCFTCFATSSHWNTWALLLNGVFFFLNQCVSLKRTLGKTSPKPLKFVCLSKQVGCELCKLRKSD